jgi:misacylated tRNA(Ala) deacylase
MVEALYMKDSYLREWDAVVDSAKDGKYVVLDRTAFFPKGGGLQCDTGAMKRGDDVFKVVFVGKFDGIISHEVDKPGLQKGDKVHCSLDWERRYKMMRSHTALHTLCAVINSETKALITGNQIDVDKIRVDFSLDDFDRELFQKHAAKANEELRKNAAVKISFMKREEAMADPSLVKLADVSHFPAGEELRIVEIAGIDKQIDGGPQVANTSEVGIIEITGYENKGKANRRLYFVLK